MSSAAYHALILEDEPDLSLHLSKILQHENIQTQSVGSVDKAISAIESTNFDVVISDIFLPERNGLEFYQYARENYPELPFILMTGYPNLDTAVEYMKLGVYDYLTKPFSTEDFLEKVHSVIEQSKQREHHSQMIESLKTTLDARLADLAIFRDIFQNQKDGLLILDMKGNVVRINPGMERLSGISEEEAVDRHFKEFAGRVFPELDVHCLSQLSHAAENWSAETLAHHRDGHQWAAKFTYFPIRDQENQVFAYGATVSNVSPLREVESALIESLQQTNRAQEAIIFGLVRLAEYRDQSTGYHLERICIYSKILATALAAHSDKPNKIDENFIALLQRAAPLHDIGKVGVPDRILLKQGKLTPSEYEVMRSHTVIGYETLCSIRDQFGEMDFLKMGIDIAYCHHEHFNGKGYPRGLATQEIPLSAQIVALADVYDALTSRRPYKRAFSHDISINTMKLQRGKQFAPELFDVFLAIQHEFDEVRRNYADNARESQTQFQSGLISDRSFS